MPDILYSNINNLCARHDYSAAIKHILLDCAASAHSSIPQNSSLYMYGSFSSGEPTFLLFKQCTYLISDIDFLVISCEEIPYDIIYDHSISCRNASFSLAPEFHIGFKMRTPLSLSSDPLIFHRYAFSQDSVYLAGPRIDLSRFSPSIAMLHSSLDVLIETDLFYILIAFATSKKSEHTYDAPTYRIAKAILTSAKFICTFDGFYPNSYKLALQNIETSKHALLQEYYNKFGCVIKLAASYKTNPSANIKAYCLLRGLLDIYDYLLKHCCYYSSASTSYRIISSLCNALNVNSTCSNQCIINAHSFEFLVYYIKVREAKYPMDYNEHKHDYYAVGEYIRRYSE